MSVKCSPFGPKPQFLDANGDPRSGAKLYFYEAGTSTKANTFTDSTGLAANSNPITLNSLGQPPNEIWFTEGQEYKALLTTDTTNDPPSSSVWTIDNLSGINDMPSTFSEWLVSGLTPTYVNTTQFTVTGDQTATFKVNRRIKAEVTAGTVYGYISAVAYASVTTVTVALDSGNLDAGLTAVSVGLLTPTSGSTPQNLGVLTQKGGIPVGRTGGAATEQTPGADGASVVYDSSQTTGLSAVVNLPASLAPNPFFQINQRAPATNADDTYAHDRWYILTQSNPVAVSTLSDVENGMATMARITQSNATPQRFGYACILPSEESKPLRGKQITFRPRVRISNSQAVRVAVLEWTGTADSVTSDVVNDWTSGTYTAGNFFLGSNLTVSGVGSKTPSAATLTDMDALTVTLGSSVNNLIIFAWVEGTAAQNVTFDIGKVRLLLGSAAGEIVVPKSRDVLAYCQAFYEVQGGVAGYPKHGAYSNAGAEGEAHGYGWKVKKRAAPTTTKNGTWAVSNCGQPTISASNVDGYSLAVAASGAGSWSYDPNSSDDTVTGEIEL